MATTTPLSADDDLFAVKGRAAPVDRHRHDTATDDPVSGAPTGE